MNATETLLKKIKHGQKRFTVSDAIVFSGLALDDVRNALDQIIERYNCRLQMTENADLIYDFGNRLQRRGTKTITEKWKTLIQNVWQVFTYIFKAWITVTLVVYFTLFVVILILLLVSGQSSKRGSRGRGPDLGQVLQIFFSLFRWRTHSGTILYEQDRHGYPYRKYKAESAILKPRKKNLISSVYDFVFGPERIEPDPEHDLREIASFLRNQNGIIVRSEVEALTGRTSSGAGYFFTDCLIRFDGNVHVNDNGVIYGRFDQLLRSAGETEQEKIVYYWDEYEPEYELTGNAAGRNSFIFFMNGVNLFISYLILSGALIQPAYISEIPRMLLALINQPVILGWIPFIFSILFFLIPPIRWLHNQTRSKKRHHNNIRKRLFRVIYQNPAESLTVEEILSRVNMKGSEEDLSMDIVKNIMDHIVIEQEGETAVNDQALIEYRFPKIALESVEVKQIRSAARPDSSLGTIILDAD